MNIRKAVLADKDFVVSANNNVNNLSGISSISKLDENFEKDILSENPKAYCYIVEQSNRQIGMFLYAYTYWANKGQGVYLSNVYVAPENRKQGVLKNILNFLENLDDVNFITMLVGNDNENMTNVITHYGAENIHMDTFYLKSGGYK